MTPLMRAASEGKLKVFKLLLKKGANLNEIDIYGQSVIGWASVKGASHIVSEIERTTRVPIPKPTPEQ